MCSEIHQFLVVGEMFYLLKLRVAVYELAWIPDKHLLCRKGNLQRLSVTISDNII